MNKETTGVICLPTLTAHQLWVHEITGQISDGMWEGARPFDHWKFWCGLKALVDPTT